LETLQTGAAVKKPHQLVKSDALMQYLGLVIAADLNTWHLVLAGKGKNGKGRCSSDLARFISNSDHELCRGRSTTAETIVSWVNAGKEVAEKEESRRAQEESNNGRIHAEDQGGAVAVSVPPYASLWCELMRAYREYTNAPTTSARPRYLEPAFLARHRTGLTVRGIGLV
jgi:hypothetical protein